MANFDSQTRGEVLKLLQTTQTELAAINKRVAEFKARLRELEKRREIADKQ